MFSPPGVSDPVAISTLLVLPDLWSLSEFVSALAGPVGLGVSIYSWVVQLEYGFDFLYMGGTSFRESFKLYFVLILLESREI